MSAYRLHYFPESGNSYKLALMLTLSTSSGAYSYNDETIMECSPSERT
jgi:hypothetical protein